jgi:hypothetical protein
MGDTVAPGQNAARGHFFLTPCIDNLGAAYFNRWYPGPNYHPNFVHGPIGPYWTNGAGQWSAGSAGTPDLVDGVPFDHVAAFNPSTPPYPFTRGAGGVGFFQMEWVMRHNVARNGYRGPCFRMVNRIPTGWTAGALSPFHPNLVSSAGAEECMTAEMVDTFDSFLNWLRFNLGLVPAIYARFNPIWGNGFGAGGTPTSGSLVLTANMADYTDYFIQCAQWAAKRGVALWMDAFGVTVFDTPATAFLLVDSMLKAAPNLCLGNEGWPADNAFRAHIQRRTVSIQTLSGGAGATFANPASYTGLVREPGLARAAGSILITNSPYADAPLLAGLTLCKQNGFYTISDQRANLPAIYEGITV